MKSNSSIHLCLSLGFLTPSPVSTLLYVLAWCTAWSWAPFSLGRGEAGKTRDLWRCKTSKGEGEPKSGPCTLSSSENSIRSSGVQLRPMGEMFSIPLRNSMKVPLCVGKGTRLLGQGDKTRPFQGNSCSVRHAVSAGTRRRREAMPTHGCFMPGRDQASTTLLKVSKGLSFIKRDCKRRGINSSCLPCGQTESNEPR